MTCYEHVRMEAEQAGGTYVTNQTVRDGRIYCPDVAIASRVLPRDLCAACGQGGAARS